MNCLVSFLLPAKKTVSQEQFSQVIERWVNASQYYSFQDLNITNEDIDVSFACGQAELAYIRYLRKKTNCQYLAARLSRQDPDSNKNRIWDAIIILESNNETHQKHFNILLCRGLHEERLADMDVLPTLPDVVKILIEEDLLDNDTGIPISLTPHKFKDLYPVIQAIYHSNTAPQLPLVIANCYQNPAMKEFITDFSNRLSCMAHYILIETEEEYNAWRILTNTDVPEELELYFRKINVKRQLRMPLTDDEAEMMSILISYYSSQCLLENTLDWHELRLRIHHDPEENTQVPLQISENTGGYYILNKVMAETIRDCRKKAGLSQIELAQLAGTTGLIISRIETLRISRIKKSLLAKLEEIFVLAPDTLANLEALHIIDTAKKSESKTAFASDYVYSLNTPPTNIAAGNVKFCRICGTKLSEDSIFCHACGVKVK